LKKKHKSCLKKVFPENISEQLSSFVEKVNAKKSHTNITNEAAKLADSKITILFDYVEID
jgi:hypothetical protein